MKLIFCPVCQDVVRLIRSRKRFCKCRTSWGKYLDDVFAQIGGPAIPLGFHNSSFADALEGQPDYPPGKQFIAFVIERNCPHIVRESL